MRFVLRHDRHRCHIVAGRSLLGSYGYDVRLLASELRKFFSLKKGIQVDVLVGKKVPGFRELHESIRSIELCRNKLFYRKSASVITTMSHGRGVCKVYEDNGTVIGSFQLSEKNDMNKWSKKWTTCRHFQQLKVVRK
jgi:hypothetical protein